MLVSISELRQREPGKPTIEQVQDRFRRLGLLAYAAGRVRHKAVGVYDAETGRMIAPSAKAAADKFGVTSSWIFQAAKKGVRIGGRLLRIER
jgi:hypothetical protein